MSIGAGNCDTQMRVAKLLAAGGLGDFRIECVDSSPAMLGRGRELAKAEGVEDLVVPARADFNRWDPSRPRDAVMANQSLHHVSSLEGFFGEELRLDALDSRVCIRRPG